MDGAKPTVGVEDERMIESGLVSVHHRARDQRRAGSALLADSFTVGLS